MKNIRKKWTVTPNRLFRHEEVRDLRMRAYRRVIEHHWKVRSRVMEHVAVEIGIGSGLRVFEIASLTCGDLSLGSAAGYLFVRRGKGGKPREVIISAKLCRVLERLIRWKKSNGESIEGEAALMVSSHTGGHYTTRALQKMFERVLRRAGIRQRRFHDMRHTYGSFLLKSSGNDLVFVKEQLGHADLTTTAVYLHALNAEKAVNALYS